MFDAGYEEEASQDFNELTGNQAIQGDPKPLPHFFSRVDREKNMGTFFLFSLFFMIMVKL